ncbi:MAG: glycerophosphodiester phosphodiesterase [Betaproteobacteria bacterium]|nr:glycerophosphodiester phosphodiesterase [Betaproteobacteria bacterium]NBY04114.1 glycerophosphodiester phosphodiesterase [Betaproteobacteria bacterium]
MTTIKYTANWPYPFWIAHRGAGHLAPENTLAAFELGALHGFEMFECDVQVSADGVAFLLHDMDLSRTTSGAGLATDQTWSALSNLDAGAWHSPGHTGTGLLRLDALSHWAQAQGHALNLELKAAPAQAKRCGTQVARTAQALWAHSPSKPLLSSFSIDALQAAGLAAPDLPRALLMDVDAPPPLSMAIELGCVAVVMHRHLCSPSRIEQAHQAGLRALAFTVNASAQAQELRDWGVDGLITDAVDRFGVAKRA